MKISIITTCFNRVNTIRETIDSVFSQYYPDIEYIIVDGASNDGTIEIIKTYQDRIAKIISEKDGGMYEAINKGIKLATGDIIGLIHSDDTLYDRQTISTIANTFKQTNADFIYGDGIYISDKNPNRIIRNWISGNYSKRKIKFGWLPLHPTCYIRREVMKDLGLYNESYKIAADTDLLIRYLYFADLNVYYLNRYIVKMRMGGLSTDSRKRKAMWKEDIRIYKSHGFAPIITKLMKMTWKVPQFIKARFI